MVNKVILLGNLGQAPEVRSTTSGNSVATLSVATSRRVKKGEEWVDETEWHKVVVWGKDAEYIGKYATKGQTVHVQGRLQTRKWQDKDGVDKYTTEVVAEDRGVHLIRKADSDGRQEARRDEPRGYGGGRQDQRGTAQQRDPAPYHGDDEIPF